MASTFYRRRSRLLKTGFFQPGNGAENTKEKSRQCLGWNLEPFPTSYFPSSFHPFFFNLASSANNLKIEKWKNDTLKQFI
jgi:hypothetical protein